MSQVRAETGERAMTLVVLLSVFVKLDTKACIVKVSNAKSKKQICLYYTYIKTITVTFLFANWVNTLLCIEKTLN